MSDIDWTDRTIDPVEAARIYLAGDDGTALSVLQPDEYRLLRLLAEMCERLSYMAETFGESDEEVRRHIMCTATHPDGSRVWPEVE